MRHLKCLAAAFAAMSFYVEATAAPDRKIEASFDCLDGSDDGSILEALCLSKVQKVVVRDGQVLRVFMENDTVKAFKNTQPCNDGKSEKECVFFRLEGYRSQNDAVVIGRWLDTGPSAFRICVYEVERSTGRIIELPDTPHYSPDGTRFVAMSACFDHCPNRIDIWSLRDGSAKMEWRHRVRQGETTHYYKFVGWQGNDQVDFRIIPEGEAEGDAGRPSLNDQGSDATIKREQDRWVLLKPPQGTGHPRDEKAEEKSAVNPK